MPRKKSISRYVLTKTKDGLCAFCLKNDDHPFLGNLLEASEMKLHLNCIFAASGLSQEKEDGRTDGEYIEGFHVSAIQNELKRGRRLCCGFCRNPGATVGCVVGSCPRSFHLPCITKAHGITVFEDPFPTYCKRHVKRQDLQPWFRMTDEPPSCCICLFSILPENTPCKRPINCHQRCKTPVLPPPVTPAMIMTDRVRRPPRRSCVTVSTPKYVQVSNGISSNGSSTWELPDSPPRPNESDHSASVSDHSNKTLEPLSHTLPDWLLDYLNKVPSCSRLATYETWQHNTVHGLCCPKAWMHRSCIAGFAVSAALHYIKCPYCADRQTFIRSIVDAGIWVPDRDAAWELEPGAFAELAPVEESEEENTSSSSSNSGSSSRSGSPTRKSQPSESSSASVNDNKQREILPEPTRGTSTRGRPPLTRARSNIYSTTRPHEQPKPVLSLVWSTQHLSNGHRGRAAGRGKSRRFTHQTIFDHPKSPPRSVSRRGRPRRLSLFPQPHSVLDSHIESRLRQATLSSFLASFRLTSPPT